MQIIELGGSTRRRAMSDDDAMAGVVASIGGRRFGQEALAQLNRWMPLCWWSIYRLFNDAPPRIHAAGSFEANDGTAQSWEVYRKSLYRHDETFLAARERLVVGQPLLVHWHADEIPGPHRAEIYLRHGLRERLTIVSSEDGDALLAINLYRHQDQRFFSDDDIDGVAASARLLLACVRRHIVTERPDVLQPLTPLERDVCEQILKGWTHEGIAADLGVAAATVKTYRDRAFDRLGIHHRNELYALATRHLD